MNFYPPKRLKVNSLDKAIFMNYFKEKLKRKE